MKFGRVQYIVIETNTDKEFSTLRNGLDLKDVNGYERVYEIPEKKKEFIEEKNNE